MHAPRSTFENKTFLPTKFDDSTVATSYNFTCLYAMQGRSDGAGWPRRATKIRQAKTSPEEYVSAALIVDKSFKH